MFARFTILATGGIQSFLKAGFSL